MISVNAVSFVSIYPALLVRSILRRNIEHECYVGVTIIKKMLRHDIVARPSLQQVIGLRVADVARMLRNGNSRSIDPGTAFGGLRTRQKPNHRIQRRQGR